MNSPFHFLKFALVMHVQVLFEQKAGIVNQRQRYRAHRDQHNELPWLGVRQHIPAGVEVQCRARRESGRAQSTNSSQRLPEVLVFMA